MKKRMKYGKREEESERPDYIQCTRRKSLPRVHVKICRVCKDVDCPERKNVVRFAKEGGETKVEAKVEIEKEE